MAMTASDHSRAAGDDAPRSRSGLQPRARATRLAILTAAADHFARHGYHATSLDRVLADSGGTKGALYFHFESKEALARAVVTEMAQQWGSLCGQVDKRDLDPLSALLVLVDEVIARLIDNPIARGGTRLLGELPMTTPEAGGRYAFGERDALALLTEAAGHGLLREGIEPSAVARQMVALVAGHRQVCDALNERQDLGRRIEEAWSLLLPTIATEPWLTQWRAAHQTSRSRAPADRPSNGTG